MPWTHRTFWIAPLSIAAILTLLWLIVFSTRLRRIYRERMAESQRERLFLASVGFFTAVAVVRGLTILIHNDIGPFHDVSLRGRHIHPPRLGDSAAPDLRLRLASGDRYGRRRIEPVAEPFDVNALWRGGGP